MARTGSTATMADVARRAGVSTATVSRVLAGVGPARPETRERVRSAAAALGFRPSGIARSLKTHTTRTIGLIVTDIENPYFPELVRAIEDAASASGFVVLLCNAANDPDREAGYLDLLVERRVDGVVIAASGLGDHHQEWLADAPLPVVLVNSAVAGVPLPAIASDNRGGGRMAVDYLLSIGHRKIGHLTAPARNIDGPDRLAGARDALREAGIPEATLTVKVGAPDVSGGQQAMQELMREAPETTAVFAYNDLMAIGAMRAVRALGQRIPDDVSVVGFDDVTLAAYVDPPLTTVGQSTAELGRWAFGALAREIDRRGSRGTDDLPEAGTDETGQVVRLPVFLQIRESTAPVRR
jgi:LacI family transcriptional regulator